MENYGKNMFFFGEILYGKLCQIMGKLGEALYGLDLEKNGKMPKKVMNWKIFPSSKIFHISS